MYKNLNGCCQLAYGLDLAKQKKTDLQFIIVLHCISRNLNHDKNDSSVLIFIFWVTFSEIRACNTS